MVVPLVDIEEVQTGRGGRTKGEKYGKYAQAIASQVQWFKDKIKENPEGKIRAKSKDIAKAMGPEFEKKSDKAIYWGLKFVLFHEGIVVTTGKAKDGSTLLVMRYATSEDKLPPSLAQVLEPSEEEMPEAGSED